MTQREGGIPPTANRTSQPIRPGIPVSRRSQRTIPDAGRELQGEAVHHGCRKKIGCDTHGWSAGCRESPPGCGSHVRALVEVPPRRQGVGKPAVHFCLILLLLAISSLWRTGFELVGTGDNPSPVSVPPAIAAISPVAPSLPTRPPASGWPRPWSSWIRNYTRVSFPSNSVSIALTDAARILASSSSRRWTGIASNCVSSRLSRATSLSRAVLIDGGRALNWRPSCCR